jgi:hypothetical protein
MSSEKRSSSRRAQSRSWIAFRWLAPSSSVFGVLLLVSQSALAYPIVGTYSLPYTGGYPSVTTQISVTGCGPSLSIPHAPAFNLTSGQASVLVNASLSTCTSKRGHADLITAIGLQNLSFTPNATKGYIISANWGLDFWVNLSVESSTPYFPMVVWAEVNQTASIVNATSGAVIGQLVWPLMANGLRHGSITDHFLQGSITDLSVKLMAGQRYLISTALNFSIGIRASTVAKSGHAGYAEISMLPGSTLERIVIRER